MKRERQRATVKAWANSTRFGDATIIASPLVITTRQDEWVRQIPVIIADARHYTVVPNPRSRKREGGRR